MRPPGGQDRLQRLAAVAGVGPLSDAPPEATVLPVHGTDSLPNSLVIRAAVGSLLGLLGAAVILVNPALIQQPYVFQ